MIASREDLRTIGEIATDLSLETYVIGGFVRDQILERKRAQADIDIVCAGDGISLAKAYHNVVSDSNLAVYKKFGTAAVSSDAGVVEFVGARKESYRGDSRKPEVEFREMISLLMPEQYVLFHLR